MNLPVFKYHPDSIATGSIERSDAECECCGQPFPTGPRASPDPQPKGQRPLDSFLAKHTYTLGMASYSFTFNLGGNQNTTIYPRKTSQNCRGG